MTGTPAAPAKRSKPVVIVGTDDDRVHVARQHARSVLGCLAAADRELGAGGEQCLRPELRQRNFKGDARAQAGFFEEQRHRAAPQQPGLLPDRTVLEGSCQGYERRQLSRREVVHFEEMPPSERRRRRRGWRHGIHVLYIYAYAA